MGLTGGLVRRVFAKNHRSEKSRWSSVRVYLCGDEFNSLLAEHDDLNSIKNSNDATVTKPSAEVSSTIIKTENEENSQTSAAIFIQSAFRGFLARKQYRKIRKSDQRVVDHVELLQEPSVEAISTEVQIGCSVDSLRIRDENAGIQHRILRKSQSQVHRLKEEWDDSTVSSNISRMRIQNRLEAMTRRERALAYAFSQQLRTCSAAKKKSARTDDKDNKSNMGWSWLERWMATRLPENSPDEGIDRRTTIAKKRLEMAFEERESCGSNDVSVNLDGSKTISQSPPDCFGPIKTRTKAARSASRMKSSSAAVYHCGGTISNKVNKRVSLRDALKEKRCKHMQENSKPKNPEKQQM